MGQPLLPNPQVVIISFTSFFVFFELRMIPLKPSLLVHPGPAPSSYVQAARLERRPTSSHSHISFFRSLLLDMQIYSPCVKTVKQHGLDTSSSLPVFGDQDKVEGKVMLDPSCSQNGRLTISLEGAFQYSSVKGNLDEYPYSPIVGKHRHVFLSSSATIPISSVPDARSTIREAFAVRKRPSTSSLHSPSCRSCEFSFEIPHGSRPCEEMPPTFFAETPISEGQGKMSCTEEIEVSYKVVAIWEASDGSDNSAILEVPILYQPDADFQSMDGSAIEPESWLEMPLMPERPIPFVCAVTLPRPQSFSRCSSIPYFVVFTTAPRSSRLIKEIAADATIVVSLVRKITITPQRPPPSPTLPDTPPASDESDTPISPFAPRPTRLLSKRVPRGTGRARTPEEHCVEHKPLPELPVEAISETRTLQTQVSIGFPKRPRTNNTCQETLPDGLYKGKVQLSKDMLPTVDWPGVSVKYYLDVSVLFGQDDVRARVPIRVY